MRLPVGSQLAIGSRLEVPVPVPRLRAQGGLVEVGVDELAMDGREAWSLLVAAGVALEEHDVQELVERTEGWPAGLYLAALAIKAGARVDDRFTFTGDDRFMGDYLRSEFLDRVRVRTCRSSPERRSSTGCPGRCAMSPWAGGVGARARSAGAQQPPGGPAGSPARVVPLPPSLPGAVARRADAARARDDPGAPHPSGVVV